MVVDFSKIKEEPLLLLKNVDGTVLQPLGFAFDLKPEFHFNETSQISFVVPKYVNGGPTPGYDMITGLRIIEWVDIGQFILVEPKITRDGLVEKKECRAYSLEYELTYKSITIPESEYPMNFWDPIHSEDTVVGVLIDKFPQWTWNVVDNDLQGKYRTLSNVSNNGYNLIKSNLQTTYGCLFDFNTLTRTVNIYSTAHDIGTSGVFISNSNLAKEIELEEKTEDVVTVLDVNGAENVDIRSVNPLGSNKIYNLDFYMSNGYFSDQLASHWAEWKTAYENERQHYFNVSTEMALITSQIVSEQARLYAMENEELSQLKNEQSTYIEVLSTLHPGTDQYEHYQELLNGCNTRIADKNADIAEKRELVEVTLVAEKEALMEELQSIQADIAMDQFLTAAELAALQIFFKEDSISEDSFVYADVDSYQNAGSSHSISDMILKFRIADVAKVAPSTGTLIYTITGGMSEMYDAGNPRLSAACIRGSIELNSSTHKVLASAYLSSGSFDEDVFPKGCITVSGTYTSYSDDCVLDPETGAYDVGSTVVVNMNADAFYMTRNTSDYEKYAVAWDLLEYGEDCLRKLAYPSYSFSVSSANFLSIGDFESFARSLKLGKKIYLDIGDGKIIEPIFVGASFDYEDKSSLSLEFSDTYSGSDATFSLVDLLDQSIAMGKTVSSERFSYNSFIDSGASSKVLDFIKSALDVSKNAIVSAEGQAAEWDSSGIHLRKWNANHTGYEPEEIAMINNKIVFTDDAWNTAKMAIGLVQDSSLEHFEFSNDNLSISFPGGIRTRWDAFASNLNPNVPFVLTYDDSTALWTDGVAEYSLGSDFGMVLAGNPSDGDTLTVTHPSGNAWGIVAPNIVGTLLAGQNLIIESSKQDGGVAAFKVDADGAALYNSTFELASGQKHILLDPNLGFGIGTYPIADAGRTAWDTDNAKFWVDADGDVHLKGDITGSNGTFSGVVQATRFLDSEGNDMMTNGKFDPEYLVVNDASIEGTLSANKINLTGAIAWGDLSAECQARVDQGKGGDIPSYIKSTYIDETNILSPHIFAGEMWATGQGDDTGSQPAFYIADGYVGGPSNPSATPLGWLCYDKTGTPAVEAQNRMFLHSEPGVAMKIESGGNMSLEADSAIYFRSNISLRLGVNFGSTLPPITSDIPDGTVFFVI